MKFNLKALGIWILSIGGLYLATYLFNLIPCNITNIIITSLIIILLTWLFLKTVLGINIVGGKK